jgi:Domain of unknown function (DUF222)/HNH endonuclease
LWRTVRVVTSGDAPPAGLAAGDRPAADVDVLARTVAAVEYELARRMHTARAAGALPLHDPGAMLAARGWPSGTARRLARCGALAAAHSSIGAAWSAGVITSEHVDPLARDAQRFTTEQLTAVIAELAPHWGSWPPAFVARFVKAADRMLHPPSDPAPDEADAHELRNLSFAVTDDTVLLSGRLPRVEGELVIAAIDAFAERLRATADHVPAAARRADALVELVNTAHAAAVLPTRGGLPVALTVTVQHTTLGDPVASTSRGHLLTEAETRWVCCDAEITPIAATTDGCCTGELAVGTAGATALDPASDTGEPGPAARIAALAALMFRPRIPLAVGRTRRTATAAQRRALAARDRGCLIPGCQIPAEACQVHHLADWARGGSTDLPNLGLLCWAHHRQVDLQMWTIEPGRPNGPPPEPGASPGVPWPANNGAPFTITRTPRHRWRT